MSKKENPNSLSDICRFAVTSLDVSHSSCQAEELVRAGLNQGVAIATSESIPRFARGSYLGKYWLMRQRPFAAWFCGS
jgi:hypothetical protein